MGVYRVSREDLEPLRLQHVIFEGRIDDFYPYYVASGWVYVLVEFEVESRER